MWHSSSSTWGPLLFLIYIKDLNNVLDKGIVYHFADDNNLLFGKLCYVMNNGLKSLTDWLRAYKLLLNESKQSF